MGYISKYCSRCGEEKESLNGVCQKCNDKSKKDNSHCLRHGFDYCTVCGSDKYHCDQCGTAFTASGDNKGGMCLGCHKALHPPHPPLKDLSILELQALYSLAQHSKQPGGSVSDAGLKDIRRKVLSEIKRRY